jgi:hypothetical protein
MAVEMDPKLKKDMATYAAIGAVGSLVIPFVGPILGAVAGAGYAAYRAASRK